MPPPASRTAANVPATATGGSTTGPPVSASLTEVTAYCRSVSWFWFVCSDVEGPATTNSETSTPGPGWGESVMLAWGPGA